MAILKRPIERILSTSHVGRFARGRVRGKRLIIAYHGIVPKGQSAEGELALFISQRDFAAHLELLREVADVAPLDRIDDEGDGRPRVAITIDDAYRGAVREGVEELVKRGMPATIFVAPARLNRHVFWWDALSSSRGTLDQNVRSHAIHSLSGSEERVRDWAKRKLMRVSSALPDHARTATSDELRAAVGLPGIAVGSHSWSHLNLAGLPAGDLVSEVRQSRAWLKTEFGEKMTDWLAYPYGLDSIEARAAVGDAGYVGALRVTGGWHRSSDVSPFARPRFNVHAGLSVAGLKARLTGVVSA